MADELLSCPFCGGEARPDAQTHMGRNYVGIICLGCGLWQDTRSPDVIGAIAAWNRRTPPTPATEEPWEGPLTDKENAMLEAAWQKHKDAAPPTPATDEREAVARAICLAHGAFPERRILAFYAHADAALSALAPIRAQEIAAARAEEQGYRHTQVAALKQVHGAEILAAEARGYAMAVEDAANEATHLWEYGVPAQEFPRRIRAIERNEHGAGK